MKKKNSATRTSQLLYFDACTFCFSTANVVSKDFGVVQWASLGVQNGSKSYNFASSAFFFLVHEVTQKCDKDLRFGCSKTPLV